MTAHLYDEYGRRLISSIHSSRDLRAIAKRLQELFPMLFYEDEERSVWANAAGATVFRATELASDPYGPMASERNHSMTLALLHNTSKTAWASMALADCIAKSNTPSALMALPESMGQEAAALHLATQAVAQLTKNWSGLGQ